MTYSRFRIALLALLFSQLVTAGESGLRFSRHYDDMMVLQRDKPVTIRGFAEKGAPVTVRFSGQTKEAKADGNGEWSVSLDALPANSKGADLLVESKGKQAKLSEVLVGDVFLFARQSTIDVSLGRDEAGKKAAANIPSVRVMMVKTIPATVPQKNLAAEATSGWTALDKKAALKTNAAAYHVAAGLSKEVDVPIGIIDLNLGYHYPIAWLDQEALAETASIFGKMANRLSKKVYPPKDPRSQSAGYNAVLHPMRNLTLKDLLLQLGNDYPYTAYQEIERTGKVTSRAHLGQAYKDAYEQRKASIKLDPINPLITP